MPERLIGRTLGKYRVESLLGTGGFAWVYAALDPDLDITVALKVLKPQYAGDADFEQRFRREASTAAKLRHPNIIKIYSVGTDHQSSFFAMDLFTQKLSQQIEVMGCLPEPAVLKLGLDIASALSFAHRQGVIHRDIKADNILFDDHGNAVVADFGIARAAAGYAEQTGTNVIMGTPQFFAPEQARGQKTDARSDLYSLGVTLFVAATGEIPFKGTDWYEIATKHVSELPPAPRSINPMVSPEMERVILKCMEKSPDDRYASSELLYGELESLARKRASEDNAATIIVSTPVTGRYLAIPTPKAKRGARRLQTLVTLIAFLAAAAAYVGVNRNSARAAFAPLIPGVLVRSVSAPPVVMSSVPGTGRGSGGTSGGQGGAAAGGGTASLHSLSVAAPAAAVIFVNGAEVGVGNWDADTLPAGAYSLLASVVAASECIWREDTALVVLPRVNPGPVVLNPRTCGTLQLSATRGNDGPVLDGGFQVLSEKVASDTVVRTVIYNGRIPMITPVLLPAGKFTLGIQVVGCSSFSDSLVIDPNAVTTRKIAMGCGDF